MSERITQAEYNAEILSIIDSLATDYPDTDQSDALHEIVDGHEWVIYTYQARQVRSLTNNPTAMVDEMGAGPDSDANNPDEQLAYFSILADVRDAMEWHKPTAPTA